jgi:hypothetical protein
MKTVLEYPTTWSFVSVLTRVSLTAIAFQVGTGGEQTADYFNQRGPKGYAYPSMTCCGSGPGTNNSTNTRTPTENLAHIRAVLKPAITDLALALGVSRQAVYDWQNGKPITTGNAVRLEDLARAADVFAADGLTASTQLLRRPIDSSKTLIDIAREGGSAEDAARNLVQRVQRELQQRQMLAARLANRKRPAAPTEDYGTPIMDELG